MMSMFIPMSRESALMDFIGYDGGQTPYQEDGDLIYWGRQEFIVSRERCREADLKYIGFKHGWFIHEVIDTEPVEGLSVYELNR